MAILWINRTHESDEFVWNDDVHVSVLHFFVVFVFFVVEFSKVVPSVAYTNLQALQALENRATVRAVAVRSISEGPKLLLIGLKSFPGNLS